MSNWEKRKGDYVKKYTCGTCSEFEFEGTDKKGYCRRYRAYYYPDDSCSNWEYWDYEPGGCYLTTACTEYYGLPDDCFELTTLRSFRDSFMTSTDDGLRDIQEYYGTAPKIVAAINHSEIKDIVYKSIYTKVILPCVELIQNGEFHPAYELYKSMVLGLQKYFL